MASSGHPTTSLSSVSAANLASADQDFASLWECPERAAKRCLNLDGRSIREAFRAALAVSQCQGHARAISGKLANSGLLSGFDVVAAELTAAPENDGCAVLSDACTFVQVDRLDALAIEAIPVVAGVREARYQRWTSRSGPPVNGPTARSVRWGCPNLKQSGSGWSSVRVASW
jgi:hypothetical protein